MNLKQKKENKWQGFSLWFIFFFIIFITILNFYIFGKNYIFKKENLEQPTLSDVYKGDFSEKEKIATIMHPLREEFGSYFSIHYDYDHYILELTPVDDLFYEKIDLMSKKNNSFDDWNYLTRRLVYYSEIILQSIGPYTSIEILDPDGINSPIVLITDGSLVYDFTQELNTY